METAKDVLQEIQTCLCLLNKKRCGVCEEGYHIFCNRYPHGNQEEAYRWFKENPEATKEITCLTKSEVYDTALKEILDGENKCQQK
jgi:hypothetical protein